MELAHQRYAIVKIFSKFFHFKFGLRNSSSGAVQANRPPSSCCRLRDILATMTPIGVKVCRMVELCPRTSLSPFGGDNLQGSRNVGSRKGLGWTIFDLSNSSFCHLTTNVSKNGKSERYMSIRARRELSTNVSHRVLVPFGHKYVVFCIFFHHHQL